MKKMFLIGLLILIFMIVSAGCVGGVNERDLKKPVEQYLSEEYGLNEEFKFLTWDDNWFEGIDHQTAIEIKKPYHTTIFITLIRDTFEIDEQHSDSVYSELFKGAYIQQNPKVTSELDRIIKKFDFLEESPDEYDELKGNFYYYINANIAEELEQQLAKQFKSQKTINTNELLPILKPNPDPTGMWSNFGVINFNFYFKTTNEEAAVPQAEEVLEEFKNSNVLTEGLYSIEIIAILTKGDLTSIGDDPRNSGVQFRVDAKGNIKDIELLPTGDL
ncbi:hypothetical protein [Bacillus sp. FJAT-18017]|uniref:hypothetical protein n=1 Tax=Bacillus sp. FJAT-18017 TaxID=1705566 RepID=UPI0006AF79CA|nr:hypothetical protein [Bacillus sp. FJAT-18017]